MKKKLENYLGCRIDELRLGYGLRRIEIKTVLVALLFVSFSGQLSAQCNASFSFSGATCASNECFDITVSPTYGTGIYIYDYEGSTFDPATGGVITDQGNGVLEFCPQDAQNAQLGLYTISYSVPATDPACSTSFFVTTSVDVQASYDPCFSIVEAEPYCPGSTITIVPNEDWTSLLPDQNTWTLDGVAVAVTGPDATGNYTFTVPTTPGTYTLMHRTNDDLCAEFCSAALTVPDPSSGGDGVGDLLQDNIVCQSDCSIDLTQYLVPSGTTATGGGAWEAIDIPPFINEIEYSHVSDRETRIRDFENNDIEGTTIWKNPADFIEIAGAEGTDLSEYVLVLYDASQGAIDNIGEGNGSVYAVLAPALGIGWYTNYVDTNEVNSNVLSWCEDGYIVDNDINDPLPACPETAIEQDLDNSYLGAPVPGIACTPRVSDDNYNQWCTPPDIIRSYRNIALAGFPGHLDDAVNASYCGDDAEYWDENVFPLIFMNNGQIMNAASDNELNAPTQAMMTIDNEYTAASGINYGAIGIGLGSGRHTNNSASSCSGGSYHSGDILAGPAGVALVHVGDFYNDALANSPLGNGDLDNNTWGNGDDWFNPDEFSLCNDASFNVVQFLGYGTGYEAYDITNYYDDSGNPNGVDPNGYTAHDPNNPIANGGSLNGDGPIETDEGEDGEGSDAGDPVNPYFAECDINVGGSYNIDDHDGDDPWNPDTMDGNADDHAGLHTNKGIFSACDGPARGLVTTDINVYDTHEHDVDFGPIDLFTGGLDYGSRSLQFTNDCWHIPDLTDRDLNYQISPAPQLNSNQLPFPGFVDGAVSDQDHVNSSGGAVEYYSLEYSSPGHLNWGQLGNSGFAGHSGSGATVGSSAEEFYFDYIAPNGNIFNLCNLCESLFVGGNVVAEDDVYTAGGGDLDGDDGVLFDLRKNQVYPLCVNYATGASGGAGNPCATGGGGGGANEESSACLYVLMDYEEYWEAPRFVCEGQGPIKLTSLYMDSIQFIPPHAVSGSALFQATFLVEDNVPAPMISEINYAYQDVVQGGTDPGILDDHCVQYNWVNNQGTVLDQSDDSYEQLNFCEGIEISAPLGTELSCYALVFYKDAAVNGSTAGSCSGTVNGNGVDVLYIGADGLPHQTSYDTGHYLQLYGIVDNDDADPNPANLDLMTVPFYGSNGGFNNQDDWGGNTIPYYAGYGLADPYGLANAPTANACGGLFFDANGNDEYDDGTDIPVPALNFPWERQTQCDKCDVGSRWFPIANITGGCDDGIGGVGMVNTCSGELVDFMSWGVCQATGESAPLCIADVADYSMAGPFENYTSTPIDTTQNCNTTADLRTIQRWSCDDPLLANAVAGCATCDPADADYDGTVWVIVYAGGDATVPACGADTNNVPPGTYSNTIGSYNCLLAAEEVECGSSDVVFDLSSGNMDSILAQLQSNPNVSNASIQTTMMGQPTTSLGSLPANYILDTHIINWQVGPSAAQTQSASAQYLSEIYSFSVQSEACGSEGYPVTSYQTQNTNTVDNDSFWDPAAVNGDNSLVCGTYDPTNVAQYIFDPLNDPNSTTNNTNEACVEELPDGTVAPFTNACYNGQAAIGGPYFIPIPFGSGNVDMTFVDGNVLPDPLGISTFQQHVEGCYVGGCVAGAQTKYSINGLCAQLFNGNDRLDTANDSCFVLNKAPLQAEVQFAMLLEYSQCFPIGNWYGPGVTINADNMLDPYWQFDPAGLAVQSPVQVTYDAVNQTNSDQDELTDDLACLDGAEATQNIVVNGGAGSANLVAGPSYVCAGDAVTLTNLLAPGSSATGLFSCPTCPAGAMSGAFTLDVDASMEGSSYIVEYTIGGEDCSSLGSTELIVVGSPTTAPEVSACEGDDVVLSVDNADPNLTYNWYEGGTLIEANASTTTITATASGTYFVEVADCALGQVPVALTVNTAVTAGTPELVCSAANPGNGLVTIILDGGDGSYISDGGGSFSGNVYSEILGDGDYSITFSSPSGCGDAVVDVTVDCPVPVLDVTDNDIGDHTVGDSVTFSGGMLTGDDSGDGIFITSVYACNGTAGTIVDNGDGTYTFTGSGTAGPDSFCYDVEDLYGQTGTASVTVEFMDDVDEPTCDDGIMNGDETDVDCGGPDCDPCTECDFSISVAGEKPEDPDAPDAVFRIVMTIDGSEPNAQYDVNGDIVQADGAGNAVVEYELPCPNGSYDYTVALIGSTCPPETIGSMYDCITTSIALLRFEGEVLTEGNLLSWTTASEIENDFFTLERSLTGTGDWGIVGYVGGSGNSSTQVDYAKLDANAPDGTSYYRLKDTDWSGNTRIASSVVALTRNVTGFGFNNVYPVPTSDIVHVEFNSDNVGSAVARIIDVTGKEVKVIQVEMQAGINQMDLDLSSFPAGTYLLTITNSEKTINAKVIKD